MGHYEKIGDVVGGQGDIQENYDIEAGKVEGGFWLERYINREDGSVEKMFIKNNAGDIIEFVDLQALRESKPFSELIKTHYLNLGRVLKDNEVAQAVESLANIASHNMLGQINENEEIEN